jgi:two-component system, NtrC family, sensor kinase
MPVGPEQHDSSTFHVELLARCAALEARLRDLEAELEHTHRLAMLGTIVGSIAHEINNILTPVVSYAALAKMYPADAALAAKALDRASSGASRAAAIAASILDMARSPTEGDASPTTDVAASVEQVLCSTGHREGGGRVEVVVEVEAGCKAAIEPIALQQVLMNLVLNAGHAMERAGGCETGNDGGHGVEGRAIRPEVSDGKGTHADRADASTSDRLTVRGSTWNLPTGEHRVRIEVEDTGCGMDVVALGRVFEPFVSERGTYGPVGTGLGLSTSRQLIERAGGTIDVRSEAGTGTVFIVDLPSAAGVRVRNSA